MNKLQQRRVLITHHGTVVYFDKKLNVLRHAAIGSCEVNLFAVQTEGATIFLLQDGERIRPVGEFGKMDCKLAIGDVATPLSEISVATGLTAFSYREYFLCAEADGLVTCSRLEVREWESFLTIGLALFSSIEFICSNRWVSPSIAGRIDVFNASLVHSHNFQIGRANIPIRELIDLVRAGHADMECPRDLYIFFDGWNLNHYSLYRPLAYFAAYGQQGIFDCLEIAVNTLFEFGEWDGDVLILTDEENTKFIDRLHPLYRNRVLIEIVPAKDVLDFTLARYKVSDLKIAQNYQPLIYIDTDVVCDSPISGFLRSVCFSTDIEVCPEHRLGHEADWYGKSLLEADGTYYNGEDVGLSSGVFAFKNTRDKRSLFGLILKTANLWSGSTGRRSISCYDQPFFNYVLYKTKDSSSTKLGRIVHIYNQSGPPLAAPISKGFVHFVGGIGNATPKLAQMTNYVSLLQRHKCSDAMD